MAYSHCFSVVFTTAHSTRRGAKRAKYWIYTINLHDCDDNMKNHYCDAGSDTSDHDDDDDDGDGDDDDDDDGADDDVDDGDGGDDENDVYDVNEDE